MRTLLVLLAVILSLGALFSDREPAPDPFDEAAWPICQTPACKRHSPFLKPKPPSVVWTPTPPGYDDDCEYVRIPRVSR